MMTPGLVAMLCCRLCNSEEFHIALQRDGLINLVRRSEELPSRKPSLSFLSVAEVCPFHVSRIRPPAVIVGAVSFRRHTLK